MFRYIAFIWNSTEYQSARLAKSLEHRLRSSDGSWDRVQHSAGLIVCATPGGSGASAPHLLNKGGVVLGTVFKGNVESPSERISTFSPDSADTILASSGRDLIRNYWGRYVAIGYLPTTRGVWILRDPSGGLPCFVTQCNGVRIVYSDVQDCLALGQAFSINWPFIAAFVSCSGLQTRETALADVLEVQAGECLFIENGAVRHTTYWDPLQIASSADIDHHGIATAVLRRVIRDCVCAWASCYRGILHRLSGGLDSSIVMSCLQDAPTCPTVTCVTYYSEGPEEDERIWAQLAARRANCPLIEYRRNPAAVRLESILQIARSPKPWYYIYMVEYGRIEANLARAKSAGALFGGIGGDSLFYQGRARLAAGDYLQQHGLDTAFFRVALDAARIDRLSIWSVIRSAIQDAISGTPWNPLSEAGRFKTLVPRDVIESVQRDSRYAHPWLASQAEAPHGKRWHAVSLSVLPPYYDPLGMPDDPESVYPLLSQPIIEACLRIPTYTLIHGGWDRSIARRAFSSDVPSQIIRRRDKGGCTHHVNKIFSNNIGFLRELLLDGLLVKHGLLDRSKLEACFSPSQAVTGLAFNEIMIDHMCTEAWLRRWSDVAQRAAA